MDHPNGGVPAEGNSLESGLKDIHPPIGYDPEFKAPGGTDAQGRNPFGFAVCVREVGDTASLGKPSGTLQQKIT
jgi:hypothetical protein